MRSVLGGSRRIKVGTIVAIVVVSGAGLWSSSHVWFVVTLAAGGTTGGTVVATGADAAPALAALSFASLALAGALSIAGPIFRFLLGFLECLIGLCVAWSAWIALTDPFSAVSTVVTQATGVAGRSAAGLVAGVENAPWPTVALGVGLITVSVGVLVAVSGHQWPTVSRRYDASSNEPDDSV
jgi:hypothetical protein